MIQRMTLNECAAHLRSHGMSISNETLAAGLENGAFPFGTAFRTSGGSRVALIYKTLLDKWIAEMETEEQP